MPKNADTINKERMISFRLDKDSELLLTKLQLYYLRQFGVKFSIADVLRTCLVNHYDALFPAEKVREKLDS